MKRAATLLTYESRSSMGHLAEAARNERMSLEFGPSRRGGLAGHFSIGSVAADRIFPATTRGRQQRQGLNIDRPGSPVREAPRPSARGGSTRAMSVSTAAGWRISPRTFAHGPAGPQIVRTFVVVSPTVTTLPGRLLAGPWVPHRYFDDGIGIPLQIRRIDDTLRAIHLQTTQRISWPRSRSNQIPDGSACELSAPDSCCLGSNTSSGTTTSQASHFTLSRY